MSRPLTYSALASGGACTLELSEQLGSSEGYGAREAWVAPSWMKHVGLQASCLKRASREARLATLFLLSASLATLAVMGVGAAGGAWRRAVEERGGLLVGGGRSPAFSQDFITLGNCETPKTNSQCARDIDYAMGHVSKHQDWYVGLHADDDPKAFQWFLHKQRTKGGEPRCPAPCHWNVASHHASIMPTIGKCHTSQKGEDCYNHVTYTIKENLPKHPEWYPGLPQQASFKVVQNYLHKQDVCPKPCGIKAELAKMKKMLKAEEKKEEVDGMPCHTAEAGEACFGDVTFAMKKLQEGMHDEWYDGKLSQDSSFEEVQAYLNKQKSENREELCPLPCSKEAIENITNKGSEKCHTAKEGDDCWKAAIWVVKEGIVKKPEWYENDNISAASTFEHVQNRLSQEKNKDRACRAPACPCESAKKGDSCYSAIMWVMKVGLVNHSKWYSDLPKHPTFEQIQMRLHNDPKPKCKLPCIFAPWWEKPTKAPKTRLLDDGKYTVEE